MSELTNTAPTPIATIASPSQYEGQTVPLRGWLYNLRASGKLLFPIFRDGTGTIQGIVPKAAVPEEVFDTLKNLTLESSVVVTGKVRADSRAPSGSPILPPNACEGTSELFEMDYFGDDKAFLTQSGQLYIEATAMALGKVYSFGPTFRAEKSKTRRHLTEFWMVEPEIAYGTLDDLMELAEGFLPFIVTRCLEPRRVDLQTIGREVAKLELITTPFPRIPYDAEVPNL